MENQALFLSKDKSKKMKCLLQFLFGALRVNLYSVLITGTPKIFILLTVVYLSIGTPKNNKFFIYPKWNINNFWVSHNLGTLLPNYNVLKYWTPKIPLIFHLRVPKLKYFTIK